MKHLVFLTVNCSFSHSGLVMALLHQACGNMPDWTWDKLEITLEEDSFAVAAGEGFFPCDLLCATLYLFNREKTLDILRRVKLLYPQIHIAVGGPECSSRESCLALLEENSFISTVFSGEGEELFPGFLLAFEQHKNLRQILPSDGRKVVYENWQNSPLPVEDIFFRTDKAFVQMETSRGCPMGCSYCSSSGVPTRYRSLEQVRRELELFRAKGIREVRVLDRTFNMPESRGESLLRLFYEYKDIHFHLEIHPQFLGRSLRNCLAEAPAHQLHIEAGMQSLCPVVQSAVRRNSSIAQALDGLRFLCGCRNFQTHVDLLAGLPEQTFDSVRHDVVGLMQCAPREIQLEILKILPGTAILSHTEQYGLIYNRKAPYEVMRSSGMESSQLLLVQKLSRLLDLFYNHSALHDIFLCAAESDPEIFLKLFDHVVREKTPLHTLMNLKKRFLFLAAFLEKTDLSAAQEELRFQWLLNGCPPGEDPVRDFLKPVGALPENFELVSGESSSLTHRESKFYALQKKERVWILLYNRKYRFNGPCCTGYLS